QGCNILVLLDNSNGRGCLVHNTRGRYQDENYRYVLPIKAGTIVFSELGNLNARPNVAFSNAIELFQGSEEAKMHASTWLGAMHGIRCEQAGGVLAEYNLRFWVLDNLSFSERFFEGFKRRNQYINF
uniref:Uncharacterized protein n=1 Tax=Clytia hemisphaerica TaxID=252671 RepID=A0A7M5XKA1_9CNID